MLDFESALMFLFWLSFKCQQGHNYFEFGGRWAKQELLFCIRLCNYNVYFFLFHYNPAFPKGGGEKKPTELCCKRSQLKQVITFLLAEFAQIAAWMAVFAYVFGNSKRSRLGSQQNVQWVFGMVKGYYRDLQGFCIYILYFAISGESILKYSL